MSSVHVVSSAPAKSLAEMTDLELSHAVSDAQEVVEYLTREDSTYEERSFAEEVKAKAVVFSDEIARRRSSL